MVGNRARLSAHVQDEKNITNCLNRTNHQVEIFPRSELFSRVNGDSMNVKTWIPLALAIVLGVIAAKVARDVLMKNKPQQTQAVKLTKVVMPRPICCGRQLQAEDLMVGEVTPQSVPRRIQ
jgi:hypothetical protein